MHYDIQHVPGKLLYTADTLSRSPIQTTAIDPELEQHAETFVDACAANLPATSGRLKQIQEAQEEDRTCKEVITHTKKGWPKKGTLDPDLIPFWQARANLTVDQNNLLLHGNRVVIPKRLQQETVHKIQDSVWSPGHPEVPPPGQYFSMVARNIVRDREHGEIVPDMRKTLQSKKRADDSLYTTAVSMAKDWC